MESTDSPFRAQVVDQRIDVDECSRWLSSADAGAVLLFCGNVRDHNRGRQVTRIDYHAYESMACKELETVTRSLLAEGATRALAIHRIGSLEVGETSIVLGVSLAHRKDGFRLLETGMEHIKSSVPVWKHEHSQDGTTSWIEGS